MSTLKTLALITVATVAATAQAEPLSVMGGTLSTTATLASDYVFRGYSQTDENFAPMATVNWAHTSGLHIDLFAAPVDFNAGNDDASFEFDAGVGYTHNFSDKLSGDFSVVAYTYPGAAGSYDYDFFEGIGTLTYDLGMAKIGGQLAYSPDYAGAADESLFAEANITAPFTFMGETFNTSAGYGRQMMKDGTDYNTWRAGVNYDLKGFVLGANYYDTNIGSKQCSDLCSARAVFSVAHTF